jgi:DNA processing protein
MTSARDSAAVVALVRLGRRPWRQYAELLDGADTPEQLLKRDLLDDGGQQRLLTGDPEPLVERAAADIAAWRARGFELITVRDAGYPPNLHEVHDRPPLIFVAGALNPGDNRSVAVVGARRATERGLTAAADVAEHLVEAGYAVVSGLAAGIDTAAHVSALGAGGRTVAVLGTGLSRSYPVENATLQRRIAARGAVISQFWPEAPPSRASFPRRNAVMSGFARGTVIVEASSRSGARTQARLALGHGRPVFLLGSVLGEQWAEDLAARPGVHVVNEPGQITRTIERLDVTDALVE